MTPCEAMSKLGPLAKFENYRALVPAPHNTLHHFRVARDEVWPDWRQAKKEYKQCKYINKRSGLR